MVYLNEGISPTGFSCFQYSYCIFKEFDGFTLADISNGV